MAAVPVVVGVAAFAIAVGPERPIYYWVIVGVAVRAARLVQPAARTCGGRATRYVVTNRRVLYRSGIVTQLGRDVPLYRLNDVHFENTHHATG